MEHPIAAIEKILNTLGSKIIKDRYGLDLKFEVDKVNEHHFKSRDTTDYVIRVNAIGDKVPFLIKDLSYDDTMWDEGRYDVPSHLEEILTSATNYIDLNYSVVFNNVRNPYKHKCDEYITLKSVGTKICKESGMTDDSYFGGLPDIDNDEWWGALSDEDKEILKSLFG